MTEAFFLAAFTAGVMEGISVLGHYSKTQKTEDVTSNSHEIPFSILAPSTVYGTVSLPLSLIGESPGPALISLFPLAPKVPFPDYGNTARKIDSTKKENNHLIDSSGESNDNVPLIQRARNNNRKALQAARRHGGNHYIGSISSRSFVGQSSPSMFYLASLEGQPLATPIAQVLRRIRLLFFGAGLVSLYWNRQHQSEKQIVGGGSVRVEPSHYMENLVRTAKQENPGGGVVIRLIENENLLRSMSPLSGRVPILSSGVSSSSQAHAPNLSAVDVEDDDCLSLTEEWLVSSVGEARSQMILVEANVSLPLSQCFASDSNLENGSFDKATFASKQIEMVARGKQLLGGEGQGSNMPSLVNVFIGSGQNPKFFFNRENSIYLNSLSLLANHISGVLEDAHQDSLKQTQQSKEDLEDVMDDTQEHTIVNEENEQIPVARNSDIFETLGQTIRRGFKASSSVLANSLKGDDGLKSPKSIHLVTDNPDFVRWLMAIMPEYKVLWYNPSIETDLEHFQESLSKGCISFVCCKSDEKTCDFVCSVSSCTDTIDTKIIALVENSRMERITQRMTNELSQNKKSPEVHIVSAEKIYSKVFSNVQRMLVAGTRPKKIQEMQMAS